MAVSKGLKDYQDRVAGEKRAAVMDAAIRLFLSDGYDGTSLEAVAKAAGVSSATVYKHFSTKADLFGGIMARLWENEGVGDASIPPAGDPRAGLLQIGRDYAALLQRQQTSDLFRVIIAEAPRFPELGVELYERGTRPYLDRLRVYLLGEIEAGLLAIHDIPLAKRQFLGMINDVVFWPRLLLVSLEVAREEVDTVVAAAVETFMAAYGAH